MLRSILTITLAAAFLAPAWPAAAESPCDSRLRDLEAVIRDHSMEIPSGSMNRMFTLQDQIRTACTAGNDQLADGLIKDLAALLAPDVESDRLEAIAEPPGQPEPPGEPPAEPPAPER